MQNIYLFYGEDVVGLRAKLNLWTKKLATQTDLLLDSADLDAMQTSFDQIQNALFLIPLISSKRMVVVRHFFDRPKLEIDRMIKILNQVPETTVLVFIEEKKIEEKHPLFLILQKQAKIEYFAPLNQVGIHKLAQKIIEKDQIKINFAAKNLLLTKIGLDSFRLINELEKLRLFAAGQEITPKMVDELVVAPLESRIFQLADAVIAGQAEAATKLMLNELNYGTDPLKILGLLISQTRSLLIIADGQKQNLPTDKIIASVKMPSFVAKKMLSIAAKKDFNQIVQYFTRLCLADINLKLGQETEPVMLNLCRI